MTVIDDNAATAETAAESAERAGAAPTLTDTAKAPTAPSGAQPTAGGMRVICAHAQDGPMEVEILDVDPPLSLKAQVAWSTRLASGEYEVGLRFVDLTREDAHRLGILATQRRQKPGQKAG